MLQVATGRFFVEPSDDRPVREAEFDDVAYSNVSFMNPVGRPGMWLRPGRRPRGGVSQYAVRLTGRYQPHGPGDIIAQPFPLEAFEQFHLLAGVWFDAIFHNRRGVVERLCLTGQGGRQSSTSLLGNMIATDRMVPADRLNRFADFLDAAMALPRADYRRLTDCLRGYRDAVEGVVTNISLAYSTLVYVLEALSQGAEEHEPRWDDFPHDRRDAIDAVLRDVAPYDAARVRSALLKGRQLRLKKRFEIFVTEHLADAFFVEEASGRRPALGRGDLPRVLDSLYATRSKVVHELRPAPANVLYNVGGPAGDVADDGRTLYLTFPGLLRLTRHVLLEFVRRRPKETPHSSEEWRRDMPGVVRARLTPRLWALNPESFHPGGTARRYCGVLSVLLASARDGRTVGPGLDKLASAITVKLPQAEKEHRAHMLHLLRLIWLVADEHDRPDGWTLTLEKNAQLLARPSVLADCNSLFGADGGDAVASADNLETYWRRKGRKTAPDLSAEVEVALRCRLANLHLAAGNRIVAKEQARLAMLDAAGLADVQKVIAEAAAAGELVDLGRVLMLPNRKVVGSDGGSGEEDAARGRGDGAEG